MGPTRERSISPSLINVVMIVAVTLSRMKWVRIFTYCIRDMMRCHGTGNNIIYFVIGTNPDFHHHQDRVVFTHLSMWLFIAYP